MARRTLWDVVNDEDEEVRSFVALIMLFAAGLFAVLVVVTIAIWCWGQHWLLGTIATICPLVGLYNYVTKDPTP